MHEIASLVTCNFKILGVAYPLIPWVPEVFLALFCEDELCEDTSGKAARKNLPARVTLKTRNRKPRMHEKPLASSVTSGPLTLDCPFGRIGPHFNLYPLLCFIWREWKLLLRTLIRYRKDTDQETAPWRLHLWVSIIVRHITVILPLKALNIHVKRWMWMRRDWGWGMAKFISSYEEDTSIK